MAVQEELVEYLLEAVYVDEILVVFQHLRMHALLRQTLAYVPQQEVDHLLAKHDSARAGSIIALFVVSCLQTLFLLDELKVQKMQHTQNKLVLKLVPILSALDALDH